jgi:predicted porin
MKKSLFAVAAVTAFAGAAQAQSSVTVYGLIDYGYQSAYQRNAVGQAVTPPTVTNQNTSGFSGNGESTSRLGFRGNEDLGGGASAFFTIEAALNTDQGGILNSGATGNRQQFVGLGKKGLGTASIGIQYTPVHEAASVTDAGGLNNQNGNVIYDRTGGFGAASGQVVAGSGVGLNSVSGMSTNTSYTIRSTNALVLKSENMAGFTAKAMLVQGGKDSNAAGGTQTVDNSGWGLGADYTWKKLFVTAAYQSFNNQTQGAGAFAPGYNGAGITPGVNTHDNQQYYAATYDFGILKGFAQYVNRKVTSFTNVNNSVSRSAQQIGVRAPITSTVQVWASAGTGSINAGGTNYTPSKFNGWQLGTDYALSKRTNLYAIYGQTATSGNQQQVYGANTAQVANQAQNSYNASSYALGVRHTF